MPHRLARGHSPARSRQPHPGPHQGDDIAKANASATAKAQKEIARQCLDGRRITKAKDWTPRYMSVPMETYLEREAS